MEENIVSNIEEHSPPKGYLKQMLIDRIAISLSNMGFISIPLIITAIIIAIFLPAIQGMIFVLIFLLALIAILFLIICTIGVLLFVPDGPIQQIWEFINKLGKVSDTTVQISNLVFNSIQYLCIVGLSASILSLIPLFLSKQKSIVRIIFTFIAAAVLTTILILYYTMGGVLWQS